MADQLQQQLMQRATEDGMAATPEQQIQQRQSINDMMSKMAPPTQPPSPVLQMPQKQGPFSLNPNVIDVESLIKAMQKSGMTHSRNEDIELRPSVAELLDRARALSGGGQ